MPNTDAVRLDFEDLNNQVGENILYVDPTEDDVDVADFQTLFQAVCASEVISLRREVDLFGPAPSSGASGPYATIDDRVTLEFNVSGGGVWPVTFAGPLADIFQADTKTVDPYQADVADLISAILSFGKTRSGQVLVEYSRGWRW